MKQIYIFFVSLFVCLFANVTSVNADVLGPYPANETISVPNGYGSVVLYMSSYSKDGIITIQDETGNIYELIVCVPESEQPPYRYLLGYGAYKIVSIVAPAGAKLQSNWGTLEVGSSFTVTSVGGYIGIY